MARRCGRRTELLWGQAGGEESLTRVVGDRARKAEPEELAKGDGLKDRVGTAVEVTNSVEPFGIIPKGWMPSRTEPSSHRRRFFRSYALHKARLYGMVQLEKTLAANILGRPTPRRGLR